MEVNTPIESSTHRHETLTCRTLTPHSTLAKLQMELNSSSEAILFRHNCPIYIELCCSVGLGVRQQTIGLVSFGSCTRVPLGAVI